jgi:uncharacterized protein YdaU (DUF1376 family)
MKKDHWFPLYVNDWLLSEKIDAMPAECEGAYIRLLCRAWLSDDCGLPDDDSILSRWSRLGERWDGQVSACIRACFDAHDGRLFNAKLLDVKEERRQWSEKSAYGGRKAARQRKHSVLASIKGGATKGSEMVSTKRQPCRVVKCSALSIALEAGKEQEGSTDFDTFWSAYPRKVGKSEARKAWDKIGPSVDRCIQTLRWQVQSHDWLKEDGKYIPHPTTWLNQGRWDDEPPQSTAPEARGKDLWQPQQTA